jgi:ABC-type nitrate/sulfonate/bicarbonate transport system substrate-binding protein
LIIAKEEGYYAKENLEVELVELYPQETLQQLTQGKLDAAFLPLSRDLFVTALGGKIRLAADGGYLEQGDNSLVLMARKDLYDLGQIKDIQGLKGKKLAVPAGDGLIMYLLSRALQEADIDTEEVEFSILPFEEMGGAFQNQEIDAALIAAPFAAEIENAAVAVRLSNLSDYLPGRQQIKVLVFGPKLIENRGLAEKFLSAYLKGVNRYNQMDTEGYIGITKKYINIDKDAISAYIWLSIQNSGKLDVPSVMGFQDWLFEKGLLDERIPATDLIYTEYIDYMQIKR